MLYSCECEIEGIFFYKLINFFVIFLIINVLYLNCKCVFCYGELEKKFIDWNLSVGYDDCLRRRIIFYLFFYEEVMVYV